MSTPYMALSTLMRNALVTFWMLWIATFAITRAYALHEAYMAEVGRRNDEQWLLQQCSDPEFYANLKQHSNLCTEVSNNARQSLLLRALSKVAEEKGLHLCGKGEQSCTNMLLSGLLRIGWRAAVALVTLLLLVPSFIPWVLHVLQQNAGEKRSSAAGWVQHPFSDMASAESSLSGHTTLFCSGPYGDAEGVDWSSPQKNGSDMKMQQYSPAMRMRKAVFFKQPLTMGSGSCVGFLGHLEDGMQLD